MPVLTPSPASRTRRTRPTRLLVAAVLVLAVLVASVVLLARHGRGAALAERSRTDLACLTAGDPAPGGQWCPTYREDFGTPTPVGSFTNIPSDDWFLAPTNPYAGSLRSYPDGWPTTGDLSLNLASRTAEVLPSAEGEQGVFRLRARTETIDGREQALGGSFYPVIRPGVEPRRAQTSQTYGRYTVRFKAIGGGAGPAAGSAGRYGTAFLLWPADDHWPDGEVDYPEMAWGAPIQGHVHTIGDPETTSSDFAASADTTTWSTATIEWSPGLLVFGLNGTEVYRTTQDVPTVAMRWGFQSGATLGVPAPGVTGDLLVDLVHIDAYVPGA